MIAFGSSELAQSRRRALPFQDGEYYKSEWMESGNDPTLSPTVFLVEQPPNTSIVPHFHKQNQFQLFVEGSGHIGGHEIETVTVHYAGAFTAYGPLRSGSDGLKYFTIRPVFESGAFILKDSRDQMQKGPKRFGQSKPIRVLQPNELSSLTDTGISSAIERGDDGMAADVILLPPNCKYQLALNASSHSHFIFVLEGEVSVCGRSLQKWEHVFATADELKLDMRAGECGAQCVLLSVPAKAPAYI